MIAIIVAGGKGTRMGGATPKQFLPLCGKPVLAVTLDVFIQSPSVSSIVLVIPERDRETCEKEILAPYGMKGSVEIVLGGKERQNSVFNGLRAAYRMADPAKRTIVLIHDGVRPFVNQALIDRCISKALTHGACIPGIPVEDTLKQTDADRRITATPDRKRFFRVQTPQAFDLDLITRAHGYAEANAITGTDDASLVEAVGEPVYIVDGMKRNLKITTREDLEFAEALATVFFRNQP